MELRTLPPDVGALERRLELDEGTLQGAARVRAETILEDATGLVLHEAGRRAEAWEVDPPRVVFTITLKAARREWDNPEGYSQEGLGEHSATVSTATGVYLTAAEKRTLHEAAGRAGHTGSVRTPSAYSARGALPAVVRAVGADGSDYGPLLLPGSP